MTCTPLQLDGGGRAIVCTRGRPRQQRCAACGAPAEYLCDGPPAATAGQGTCDAPLCAACRTPRGAADLCADCAAQDRRCGTCAHCALHPVLGRWCRAGRRAVPVLHAWLDARPACGPLGRWWQPGGPVVISADDLARARADAKTNRRTRRR